MDVCNCIVSGGIKSLIGILPMMSGYVGLNIDGKLILIKSLFNHLGVIRYRQRIPFVEIPAASVEIVEEVDIPQMLADLIDGVDEVRE
ncbi:hypothetical protein R1flu_028262 [Riccia fluitans]|uniref:Uncharacterized protein n=1 Tax=Riccia fluitans TaxID=41844 RepID=A0ABD1XLM9_9MARC